MSSHHDTEDDFFGIEKLSEVHSSLKQKEFDAVKNVTDSEDSIAKPTHREMVHSVPFGVIRYDSENPATVNIGRTSTFVDHEQRTAEMASTNQDDQTSGADFITDQYFKDDKPEEGFSESRLNLRESSVKQTAKAVDDGNPIHEQYFSLETGRSNGQMEPPDAHVSAVGSFPIPTALWKRSERTEGSSHPELRDPLHPARSKSDSESRVRIEKKRSPFKAGPAGISSIIRTVSKATPKTALDPDSGKIDDAESAEIYEDFENPTEEGAKYAFDAVRDIRLQERKKQMMEIAQRDRDGSLMSLFRLWSLIPNVYRMSTVELVNLLKQRILYQQNDLLFLNKPYGVVSQDGASTRNSISSLLPRLTKEVFPNDWADKKLYLCQRLDKETTGAMIFATNWERKEEIASLMIQSKIVKKYLCITKGIPHPEQGTIRIPLGQRLVGGRFKMIPCPEPSAADRSFVPVKDNRFREEAETEYKVLSAGVKCALVECTVRSGGLTHQVRSHLGFGLNCPVIGDHKYSNFLSFKPQRVPGEVLSRLGLRSSKARDLPMYLHAREVLIPEYVDGRNLFFRAPVPQFFWYTMKKLKLSIK